MLNIKSASLALLMGGSVLAMPANKRDVAYVTDTVTQTAVVATVTAMVTPGAPTPTAAPSVAALPTAAPSSSASSGNVVDSVVSGVVGAVSGATGGSNGSDPSYMSTVNLYRGLMGLSTLSFSQAFQDGIQQTVDNGNGQMVHAFNDDATGQVLAPATSFYNAFVEAWLCEIPSLPGLEGKCDSGLYDLKGDTGHADILKNPDLTQIGCASADGIWGCDCA